MATGGTIAPFLWWPSFIEPHHMTNKQHKTLSRIIDAMIVDATKTIPPHDGIQTFVMPTQEAALLRTIAIQALTELVAKYVAGQHEHGGSLLDKNMRPNRRQELIDAMIYDIGDEIKERSKWTNVH